MRLLPLLKFSCLTILSGALMTHCRKTAATTENPGGPTGSSALNADSIANRLRFFNAEKKQGPVPAGPSASSLKISFKDTLYLVDDLKRPIKFQHADTTQNVAGAFVQVHYTAAGGSSSFYYDVPELPEMADNDSVSVVLVGIDPAGLVDPRGVAPAGRDIIFEMTIVPYGGNHQPIAHTKRPVIIIKQNNNPDKSPCGLVLKEGDYWLWDNTQIVNTNGNGLAFYNDDWKKWGDGGQFIAGCCIDGKSSYDINCAGNQSAQKKLLFPTWFWYVGNLVQFYANGNFERHTEEVHALPEPQESNFCLASIGNVSIHEYSAYYAGNWNLKKLATPFKGDSIQLTMLTTAKNGIGGISMPGGIIHHIDCKVLVLIQPDREGGARHEVSYFKHVVTNDGNNNDEDDGWYVMW
jgi:hypothetical protein